MGLEILSFTVIIIYFPHSFSPLSRSTSSIFPNESPTRWSMYAFHSINGRSWRRIQKLAYVMFISLTYCSPSNSLRIIRFLSKFHGFSRSSISLSFMLSNIAITRPTPNSKEWLVLSCCQIFFSVVLKTSLLWGLLVWSLTNKYFIPLATTS